MFDFNSAYISDPLGISVRIDITSTMPYRMFEIEVIYALGGRVYLYEYSDYLQVGSLYYYSYIIGFDYNTYKDGLTAIIKVRPSGVSTWQTRTVTNEVEPVSNYPSEYYPPYYPVVTSQEIYDAYDSNGNNLQADSCVANTLSTIKEIHMKRKNVNRYDASIGWIYGNRRPTDSQSEGMMFLEALSKLKEDGVPSAKDIPENNRGAWYLYPDVYRYNNFTHNGNLHIGAKTLVQRNYASLIEKSRLAKIFNYTQLSRGVKNVELVKKGIVEDGAVMMSLRIANNFDYARYTGIISQPDAYNYNIGHSLALIGWKKINGKTHFIAQNSWGTWWGDAGLCYVPIDYLATWNYFIIKDTASPRPTNWTWTQSELNLFNNNGLVGDFNYTRWNEFIDKVNEFRAYKGLSAIGGKMTISNKTLTATKFKEVAQGIRDMTNTLAPSLTTVNSGDTVFGWYFPHMADAITYI